VACFANQQADAAQTGVSRTPKRLELSVDEVPAGRITGKDEGHGPQCANAAIDARGSHGESQKGDGIPAGNMDQPATQISILLEENK
jgi:hypothetical protein